MKQVEYGFERSWEILVRFLKERGAYPAFIKNNKCSINELRVEMLYRETLFGETKPSDILDYAFCWARTEEGHRFWNGICMDLKYKELPFKITKILKKNRHRQ